MIYSGYLPQSSKTPKLLAFNVTFIKLLHAEYCNLSIYSNCSIPHTSQPYNNIERIFVSKILKKTDLNSVPCECKELKIDINIRFSFFDKSSVIR